MATLKQKICEKFNLHNWVIDQVAMRELEKSGNKRGIYRIYFCTKCGMRHEIENNKKYFLS